MLIAGSGKIELIKPYGAIAISKQEPTELLFLFWTNSDTGGFTKVQLSFCAACSIKKIVKCKGIEARISSTLDGTTYTVKHSGSKYTLDGEEVDFDDIKSAVDGLDIAEYSTETSDKKQEISLTAHLDNKTYPELTLTAAQYDGENCLVTLNGETLGFAKRSLVADLQEAVNAVVLGGE